MKILLKFKIFERSGPAKRKIWENEEIWVASKIVLKFKIFDHPCPAKYEFWQNLEILVALKIVLKFQIFVDYSLSFKMWNFVKSRNFSRFESHTQISDFWPT